MGKQKSYQERREIRDLKIGLFLLALSAIAVLAAASFTYNLGG
jgi:hypothetical protein